MGMRPLRPPGGNRTHRSICTVTLISSDFQVHGAITGKSTGRFPYGKGYVGAAYRCGHS